jgi:hypothetical protein
MKKQYGLNIRIIISSLLTAVIAGFLLKHGGTGLDFWTGKIIWPLTRLFGIMLFSLWLSALIEARGWSRFTASLSMPLLKLGNFSEWSATAFSTAFISGITSNTLLWNVYREKKISKKEMVLAVLLNAGLPSYVLHLPVTFAIIVPLAGPAGAAYMGITLAAAILRTFFIIVAGRLLIRHALPTSDNMNTRSGKDDMSKKRKNVSDLFHKYVKRRFYRIATYTVPIYLFVILLQAEGIFEHLREMSAGIVHTGIIPIEGISVVVFALVSEFASGAAAAGAMLAQGVLSVQETVLALVIGNIIAAPVRAIRHQLPRYMGIFRPVTGFILLVTSQLSRIVSVALCGAAYYFLTG